MAYGGGFGLGYGMTPWVKRLLIANVAVFVLVWAVPVVGGYLALVPGAILFRPWTLVTYAFVHAGIFHLLFNMLGLFFFGPPLEARWGETEFLKFYTVSALGGAVLSFVFAPGAAVVGASAAVFGVMLAFAMNWPDAPIYFWGIFPIKAKWLVAILAGLSLFSAISGGGNGVAHFAHLGGFAAAFLYLRFSDAASLKLAGWKKRLSRPNLKVVSGGGSKPAPPARRGRDEERLLDEVDRVLDKISASGMSSLTAEERKILDEVSRRYRRH